ncbi:MAG TPA: hypothetical protein VLI04_16500 [Nocardioidaceae bacterium]|nr:hypothetical protein [Nocardioidaceae bacterium]
MNRQLNIGYLVVGLIFLGVSGTWLLDDTGVINPNGYEWLLPAILLGAGLIGLFASLGKGLLNRSSSVEAPATTYEEETTNGDPS